jgi:hypothetical protein
VFILKTCLVISQLLSECFHKHINDVDVVSEEFKNGFLEEKSALFKVPVINRQVQLHLETFL